MARLLYLFARWAFRRRRIVVAFWLVVFIGGGVGAATLSGPTSDEFTLPGIESAQAFDLIKERSPGATPDGAQANIVVQAAKGTTLNDADVKAEVEQMLTALTTDHVASVTSPYDSGTISKDGTVGVAHVQYSVQALELKDADREAAQAAEAKAEAAGLHVAIGGDAAEQQQPGASAELFGIVIALFVLVFTFGSLLAAGLPLLTGIFGVGIGVMGITIATGFIDIGSSTPLLATMLGLAVGIDYALFIVSRYRHELVSGKEPEEAAGRAVGTAGSAVVIAGLTVVIALSGLFVVNIGFLTEMGLAAAATVVVAVLIAISLLPAIFGFAQLRLLRKLRWFRGRVDIEDGNADAKLPAGRRWADFVLRHRPAVFGIGVLIAVIVALPALSLKLALPDDGSSPKGSGPREAYDLIADNFGPGVNGPLLVVVDTKSAKDPMAAIDAANQAVERVKGDVISVTPAGPADDTQAAADAFDQQLEATSLATITIVPNSGPADSHTQDLVGTLRDALDPVEASTGSHIYVSGVTAVGVDVSDMLAKAFPKYLLLIVGLAFILLVLVFRSILVPVKAVVGFLFSILTAVGATVAVFQWGWFGSILGVDEGHPIMSMLPILMTGILFGLAMDYELFLVTRMHEEHSHGSDNDTSIAVGFQHGARVVTAAALIMTSVFGSFAFTDNAIIKSIGFALALGILVDAFLVRMTLVPAFMSLVGEKVWWLPQWLQRFLPNLDVEGAGLTRYLEEEPELESASQV